MVVVNFFDTLMLSANHFLSILKFGNYLGLLKLFPLYVTGYGKTQHLGSAHNPHNALSISGQKMSKSRFCHIHVQEPFFCYRRLRRLAVSYNGKISLHFDLPSLYSCHARSP